MGHAGEYAGERAGHERPPLDLSAAKVLAATLQALASPSRLLILDRLRAAPATVGDLVESVGMEQSAVSHQLRLLRNLGLVVGDRHGRTVVYQLHDDHVAALLDQALHHAEHLRLGSTDATSLPTARATAGRS